MRQAATRPNGSPSNWLLAAALAQLLRQFLGLVAARHVDDPGPRLLRHQRLELGADAVARTDVVADVGPVEAGDDQPVFIDAELDEDVGAGLAIGGRG